MKRTYAFIGALALAAVLAMPATAQSIRKDLGEVRYDKAVLNLLNGADTNIDGLRRSAVYQLGELEAQDAVVPLMGILRTSKDELSRVAAGWALCKIGDERGLKAVKDAVASDDSPKVRLHCAWYYNLYVSEGTFTFVPTATAPNHIAENR